MSQGAGIIKLALQNDYRVLFVGNARQHNSVESGDFFRLLEEHTQIPKATLTQIHRQQTAEYRKGIELASTGLALEGFETLDHGGFVREGEGRYLEEAAESFMELTDQGKNPLNCIAVSPTHRECDALTAILREKLKAAGRLKAKTERTITAFQSFGWTKAQLGNIANYQPGMKLFFTTRLKGVGKPGEMVGIEQVKSSGELVLSNGLTVNPRKIRSAVDVGKSTELPVAEGDLVRFTVNLKTPEFRISNGSLAIATAIPNEYRLLDAERRITGTVCLPESFHGIRACLGDDQSCFAGNDRRSCGGCGGKDVETGVLRRLLPRTFQARTSSARPGVFQRGTVANPDGAFVRCRSGQIR